MTAPVRVMAAHSIAGPSPEYNQGNGGAAERVRRIPAGQLVYESGQPAAVLYILAAGRVHLRQRAESGVTLVTEALKPGALFGLDSLAGMCHAETAVAVRSALVRELPLALMDRLLSRQPGFAAGIMEAMLRRRVAVERTVSRAVVAGVPGRLAGALLDTAEDGLVSGLTRQQLAEVAWTTRETATRMLYHFLADGLVRVEGRDIYLLRPERLRQLAAGATYHAPVPA